VTSPTTTSPSTPSSKPGRSAPPATSARPGGPSTDAPGRLASYNDYRSTFGLERYTSFDQLTKNAAVRARLEGLCGTIDRLEWYVGIFAEDYGKSSMMGGLLTAMVAYDAFTQALTNPLLARRVYSEATFSAAGLEQIESTKSLQQIVTRNSAPGKKAHASFKV
jgi:prostaglandin-endoperoxide synthase 2